MTKLQAVRKFINQISELPVTIARDRLDMNWGMVVHPCAKTPRLYLPKNFDYNEEKDKQFRQNFISRCKMARGFCNTTLAILHEMGHWETRSVFNSIAYDKLERKATNQIEYMENPYERIATEWAICWLQVPEHRAMAKQFEKEYFGY